ncbi:hypothetical protein OHA72_39480 [Dactylosporangium sp. NBC_01737]|uniref:hypothetical protein n=1 Tax=Dactylosporangium sp. NBC_01737 TaxID=2975959 RepID=UPI002E0E4DD8|nr:hypothetical protein OHA72_39480 [Dactylosporangium sp. NBC_01737]
MPDLWTAPAGTPADLRVLPMLPIPAGAHVEQLIWHGDPAGAGDAPLRLTTVGGGTGGRVQTLRLLRGERLVADLRVRHGAPATSRRTGCCAATSPPASPAPAPSRSPPARPPTTSRTRRRCSARPR